MVKCVSVRLFVGTIVQLAVAVGAEGDSVADGIRATFCQGAQVMNLEKGFPGRRDKGSLLITTLTFSGCGHEYPGFDLRIPHITHSAGIALGWLLRPKRKRENGLCLILDDLMLELGLPGIRLAIKLTDQALYDRRMLWANMLGGF